MAKLYILFIVGLTAIGVLLVSHIQIRYLKKHGLKYFYRGRFFDIFWRNLSKTERYEFWIGFFLLLLPLTSVSIFIALD